MEGPTAFLHRMLISYEPGHSSGSSQLPRVLRISVKWVLRYNLISSSAEERLTSWSLSTSVMGRSGFSQNPSRIGGSGRPVTKNLTDFVHIAREHRKERGCGLLLIALIGDTDDDQGGDFGFLKGRTMTRSS